MTRDRAKDLLPRRERSFPERRPVGFESLNPFGLMRRFSDEMDRMFGDLFNDVGSTGQNLIRPGQTEWLPAIEVRERNNNIIVRAELPGLNPEDVKVEVQDDGLLIAGEIKHEEQKEEEGYFHSERRYGRFSRFIPLPDNINADQIRANFRNGLLEVVVPVPEQARNRRQIQIQTETKGKSIEVGEGKDKETDKKSAKAQ
jgi:HSP20 family protein